MAKFNTDHTYAAVVKKSVTVSVTTAKFNTDHTYAAVVKKSVPVTTAKCNTDHTYAAVPVHSVTQSATTNTSGPMPTPKPRHARSYAAVVKTGYPVTINNGRSTTEHNSNPNNSTQPASSIQLQTDQHICRLPVLSANKQHNQGQACIPPQAPVSVRLGQTPKGKDSHSVKSANTPSSNDSPQPISEYDGPTDEHTCPPPVPVHQMHKDGQIFSLSETENNASKSTQPITTQPDHADGPTDEHTCPPTFPVDQMHKQQQVFSLSGREIDASKSTQPVSTPPDVRTDEHTCPPPVPVHQIHKPGKVFSQARSEINTCKSTQPTKSPPDSKTDKYTCPPPEIQYQQQAIPISVSEKCGLVAIRNNNFHVYNVPGDGNCFFHCLTLATHGHKSQKITTQYRATICNHIIDNWQQFEDSIDLVHDLPELSPDCYRHYMITKAGYASLCEVQAAANILKCDFHIWVQGRNNIETIFTLEMIETDDARSTITLLLCNQHFLLLRYAGPLPLGHTHSEDPSGTTSTQDTTTGQGRKHVHVTTKRKASSISSNSSHTSEKPAKMTKRLEDEVAKQQRSRKYGISFSLIDDNTQIGKRRSNIRRNERRIEAQRKKIMEQDQNLPEAAPLSEDNQFNIAMDSIRAFEIEQMSYKFKSCVVCQERRLEMKMKSETVCRRCSNDKSEVKMFSSDNFMDPGDVPEELANLTIVEQQLISRISPSINVHMLKHGGIAANGHCVTFPQAITEVAKIFPKLPEEINIIRVRRQGRNDTTKEFNVRRFKVQAALIWLQKNNEAYSDIIISSERLSQLPVDGELADISTVDYNEDTADHIDDKGPAPAQTDPGTSDGEDIITTSGVLLPEPTVDIRQNVENVIEDVIGPEHGKVTATKRGRITIPWPTRGNLPLSEFTTRNFFTLAFPCLFPHGTGDFYSSRRRSCESMSDWADHLLWYKDGRFSNHHYFKFIVHNMIMRRRALDNSSYIVKQQLGDQHLTIGDRQDQEHCDDSEEDEEHVNNDEVDQPDWMDIVRPTVFRLVLITISSIGQCGLDTGPSCLVVPVSLEWRRLEIMDVILTSHFIQT